MVLRHPLNSATLDATSNFIYRGSPSLKPPTPMSGRTYGNISFESAPGGWLAPTIVNGAGTLTVLGNFYISSGVVYNTNQTGLMSFAWKLYHRWNA